MDSPKHIYELVVAGDKITNNQLADGYMFFRDLAANLFSAGPVFLLAAKEANDIANTLKSFGIARGLFKIDSKGQLITTTK